MQIIIDDSTHKFTAKIVADIGKTIFAIGLASYFFEKFPSILRICLGIICFVFIVASIFIYSIKERA